MEPVKVRRIVTEAPEEEADVIDKAAGVGRRFLDAATWGFSEFADSLDIAGVRGGYSPPNEDWRVNIPYLNTSPEELAGGAVTGNILARKLIAPPAIKYIAPYLKRLIPSLADKSRTGQTALAMGESALLGPVEHMARGGEAGDIPQVAATAAAFGGAFQIPVSAAGYLIARGFSRKAIGPKTGQTVVDPTIEDPFSRPLKSSWDGMNNGLMAVARKWGVPESVIAARPNDILPKWIAHKSRQAMSMEPDFHEYDMLIEARVQEAFKSLPESMTAKPGKLPIETGRNLQEEFERILRREVKGEASAMYEDALATGLGDFRISAKPLSDRLSTMLDESGFGTVSNNGSVNKLKRLIAKINTAEEVISQGSPSDLVPTTVRTGESLTFNELWKEIQNLYPSKKSGWNGGDMLAAEARHVVKDFIRDRASEVHPTGAAMLAKADRLWQRAKKLEESELFNILKGQHPEKVVNNLASDVTTLRLLRKEMDEIWEIKDQPSQAPDFISVLAQRRISNLIYDSIDTKTGRMSPDLWEKSLKNVGGKNGNVQNEYLDELLLDHPEVLDGVVELTGLLRAYEPSREMLRGDPAAIRSLTGDSPGGLPGKLGSIDRLVSMLVNFASGGKVPRILFSDPKVNPFFGGTMSARPSAVIPTLSRVLRRGSIPSSNERQPPRD